MCLCQNKSCLRNNFSSPWPSLLSPHDKPKRTQRHHRSQSRSLTHPLTQALSHSFARCPLCVSLSGLCSCHSTSTIARSLTLLCSENVKLTLFAFAPFPAASALHPLHPHPISCLLCECFYRQSGRPAVRISIGKQL